MSRRTIFHLTLRGLPELRLFPDDASRDHALAQLGAVSRARDIVLFAGVSIVMVGSIVAATRLLVPPSFVLYRFRADLGIVTSIIAMALLIRSMHRRGSARQLREALLGCAVPVCLRCGYPLRGLPSATLQCPECGSSLGERERAVMDQPRQ